MKIQTQAGLVELINLFYKAKEKRNVTTTLCCDPFPMLDICNQAKFFNAAKKSNKEPKTRAFYISSKDDHTSSICLFLS